MRVEIIGQVIDVGRMDDGSGGVRHGVIVRRDDENRTPLIITGMTADEVKQIAARYGHVVRVTLQD